MFTFSVFRLVVGPAIGSVDGVIAFVVAVVANTILYRINDTQKMECCGDSPRHFDENIQVAIDSQK